MVVEFEERLSVAKKTNVLVFPRGAPETNAHFLARMKIAKTSKRVIMPKSAEEPERGFHMRIDMGIACQLHGLTPRAGLPTASSAQSPLTAWRCV